MRADLERTLRAGANLSALLTSGLAWAMLINMGIGVSPVSSQECRRAVTRCSPGVTRCEGGKTWTCISGGAEWCVISERCAIDDPNQSPAAELRRALRLRVSV